jgi:uncharacterized membrane protein
MGPIIYFLCAATSLLCAWQLYRAYRRSRVRMLFWSAGCFALLTLSNLLLVLDRLVFAEVDLSLPRLVTAFVGLALLVFGLVWETD